MPNRDGTGPAGQGPRTGRGAGNCAGHGGAGRFGGRGLGRGRRGRGFGSRFWILLQSKIAPGWRTRFKPCNLPCKASQNDWMR